MEDSEGEYRMSVVSLKTWYLVSFLVLYDDNVSSLFSIYNWQWQPWGCHRLFRGKGEEIFCKTLPSRERTIEVNNSLPFSYLSWEKGYIYVMNHLKIKIQRQLVSSFETFKVFKDKTLSLLSHVSMVCAIFQTTPPSPSNCPSKTTSCVHKGLFWSCPVSRVQQQAKSGGEFFPFLNFAIFWCFPGGLIHRAVLKVGTLGWLFEQAFLWTPWF